MEVLEFGVCRLSVVPVRAETSDKGEQVTQLLFGDHYEVITEDNERKWVRVRTNYDSYEGWIDAKQHHVISKEYFEYLNHAEFKITTDVTSSILYNKSRQVILMGSMIPISSSELFKMEEQFAFIGEAKNLGQKREFEFVRTTAVKYLNSPYLWGGKSTFGVDCSGFTQMVFKICGYRLFRDSGQQAQQGKSVMAVHEAKSGDLAFFKNHEGKINHVGILLEKDKIIHSSGRVRVDTFTEEGIMNQDTKQYTHWFSHLRRILPE
jgi:gamma-D-glutamyl-L-lysine dipeptidyl-peptidase